MSICLVKELRNVKQAVLCDCVVCQWVQCSYCTWIPAHVFHTDGRIQRPVLLQLLSCESMTDKRKLKYTFTLRLTLYGSLTLVFQTYSWYVLVCWPGLQRVKWQEDVFACLFKRDYRDHLLALFIYFKHVKKERENKNDTKPRHTKENLNK